MALEYDLDVNGVLLEGVPTNVESCYLLQKVSGLDDRPVTDDVDARAVGDGDVFGAQSARGISLTIEGLIVAASHQDLRSREHAIRAACPTGDAPWPVTITGRAGDPVGGLQAAFRKSGPIQMGDDGGSSGPRFIKPFQLALRSESPDWVDPSPAGFHEADVLPESFGGFDWPVVWPVDWGDGLGDGTTVTNDADPVPPVLVVHGPCDNGAFDNLTTGETIFVSTSLADGETLVLDTRARTATRTPDGANVYRDVNRAATRWWRLASGQNQIRFRPALAGVGCKLVVQWRDTTR